MNHDNDSTETYDFNDDSGSMRLPVIKFGNKEIDTRKELAEAISADQELGRKYLLRGFIDNWAMKFDESLANDIVDVRESQDNDTEKLMTLFHLLDPSRKWTIDESINASVTSQFNDITSLFVISGYTAVSLLSGNTGESEIYHARKGKEDAVIKLYYPAFKPNQVLLKKIHELSHPNMLKILEYGYYDGRFYEIMEHAEGGSLEEKRADGMYKYLPMNDDLLKKVISDVLKGIKSLHENGILHRDIKPSNIFCRKNCSEFLIGDMGIASVYASGTFSIKTGALRLTAGFAAPECFLTAKDGQMIKIAIGPAVDYYSLGMTVYTLATGNNPFTEREFLSIARDTADGRMADYIFSLPEAASISGRVKELIHGLIAVDPGRRWGYEQVAEWLRG